MTAAAYDSSSGELHYLGIDEVEPWVCENTSANRTRLRQAKLKWEYLLDEEGHATNLIKAYSAEKTVEERLSAWEFRKPIMVDPDDPWSDYVGPMEYPMDGVDLPWWMALRLQAWRRRERDGEPHPNVFPTRCEVRRHDGTRCWQWARHPEKLPRCRSHAGWHAELETRNAQIARYQLLQAAPAAANTLEALLDAESEPVRLKASTEILDRIGVRGGVEIDQHVTVEQVDTAQAIAQRLDRLRERLTPSPAAVDEGVTDAEVVEETVDEPDPS